MAAVSALGVPIVTDARIRDLERQAAAQGDLHSQAAVIRESLRSGTHLSKVPQETECHGDGDGYCDNCGGNNPFHNISPCKSCGGSGKADCHVWKLGEQKCPGDNYAPCAKADDGFRPHPPCGGSGVLPYDPTDYVHLQAYSGNEAARLVVGEPKPWASDTSLRAWSEARQGRHVPCLPTPNEWATGLLSLAAKLPTLHLVGGVECDEQPAYLAVTGHPPLCQCKGTGRKPYSVSYELWVSVSIAVGMGRATWMRWAPTMGGILDEVQKIPALRALNTAAAWLKCPCPTNADAAPVFGDNLPDWALIPYQLASGQFPDIASRIIRALTSATELLDPKAVRTAAQGALQDLLC